MTTARWSDTENAPEYAEALRAAGLPVLRCERQRHHPRHVRTHYARKPTLAEKTLAEKVRRMVKAGTFDVDALPEGPPPAPREPIELPGPAKPTGRPGVAVRTRDVASPVEATGLRNLALELIRLALTDASNGHGARLIDVQQARLFLTAEHGDWAAARELWCALADLDPDAIREAAVRHLNGDAEIRFPKKAGPRAIGA